MPLRAPSIALLTCFALLNLSCGNERGLAQAVATALALLTQPASSAQSGVPLSQQPVIQLRDASANDVKRSGIGVTAAIASGGGTLEGPTSASTNADGRAAFSNLTIRGVVGERVLTFSVANVPAVVSTSITLAAGPANKLGVATQPSSSASSGVAFPQQPAIQVRDSEDNVVAQAGVAVTAAIANGGGTLGGTNPVNTDASGTAAFSNLQITGADGARTLVFSASGLVGTTSAPVVIGSTTLPVPIIEEDFSTYTSTASMLSDPRGIYLVSEDANVSRIALDQTIGFGSSTKSMRYDYPAGNGTDFSIGRGLRLPPGTTEIWIEAWFRLQSNFTIQNPNVVSSAAFKFLHIGVNPDGIGRFGLGFNNGDNGTFEAEVPFDVNFDAFHQANGSINIALLRDQQWHRVRHHIKTGPTDTHEYWMNNTLAGSRSGQNMTNATTLWIVELARNINRQPPQATSLWWGSIKVWTQNPGW